MDSTLDLDDDDLKGDGRKGLSFPCVAFFLLK
jgi:hypothetical protein